jgi:hypothetical protein
MHLLGQRNRVQHRWWKRLDTPGGERERELWFFVSVLLPSILLHCTALCRECDDSQLAVM